MATQKKTRSEDQIACQRESSAPPIGSPHSPSSTAPTMASVARKYLKEKSFSTVALRVGPFAAIRENELKKKKKTSLDADEDDADDAFEQPSTMATTTTSNGSSTPKRGDGAKPPMAPKA